MARQRERFWSKNKNEEKLNMYIVVDVGGTSTRIASFLDGETIQKKERYTTPQSYRGGIKKIIGTIQQLSKNHSLSGVAIGIPGTIDRKKNKTLILPHLTSWNDRDVCRELQKFHQVPITLANDAELAALGEAVVGSGKKYRIVAYLTVSTGIGGALVINKKLIPRAYTSEPGHMMRIIRNTQVTHSGTDKWEASGSGLAFEKRYGVPPEENDDPKVWAEHAQILGPGILAVILLWSPEVLVIGGGLSMKGDLLFKPLREYIQNNLSVFPSPPIFPAKLGDDAGLFGGLALLKGFKK